MARGSGEGYSVAVYGVFCFCEVHTVPVQFLHYMIYTESDRDLVENLGVTFLVEFSSPGLAHAHGT